MTSSTTDEIASFRQEVRDFVAAELPSDLRQRVLLGKALEKDDYIRWQKILYRRGWIAGHWPKHLGGCDWTPLQRWIFEEETTQAGAPWVVPFGINYVGPVIYTFGNEQQKQQHLPGILTSDVFWCQGYSEPNAGSDLAGLQTRARRDGDDYIVRGQKIWTSYAHWADWVFCLVRTAEGGKPQEGISFLLIDMRSPGITVRPIITIDMGHHVNEVFFDDVRVPAANLVGQESGGWTYAKFLLANERVLIAEVGKLKRLFRQLRAMAADTFEAGQPLLQDPSFGRKVTELSIGIRVLEAMCIRQLGAGSADAPPGVEASVLKIRGSELFQDVTQLMVEVQARRGLPYQTEALSPNWNGAEIGAAGAPGMMREYLFGRAATIYGGSNEIQRNVIAKAALEL
jgi:alkylation response protein AidB-like acyl-CoA dehydrogenase